MELDMSALDPRVLRLTFSEVAAFVAVVEHGSFTAAATAMHISQPGMTARVQRLERSLGITLVERTVKSLTLTNDGRIFLATARHLLDSLDRGIRVTTRNQSTTTRNQATARRPGASVQPVRTERCNVARVQS